MSPSGTVEAIKTPPTQGEVPSIKGTASGQPQTTTEKPQLIQRIAYEVDFPSIRRQELGLSEPTSLESSPLVHLGLIAAKYWNVGGKETGPCQEVPNSNYDVTVDDHFGNEYIPCQGDLWTDADFQAAEIWTWGTITSKKGKEVSGATGDGPAKACKHFRDRGTHWPLPIHQSLLKDLGTALYGNRLEPERLRSKLYAQLQTNARGFMRHLILQLSAGEEKLFESGRPLCHVFVDIIACITFLKRRAGDEKEKEMSLKEMHIDICTDRKEFWRRQMLNVEPTSDAVDRRVEEGGPHVGLREGKSAIAEVDLLLTEVKSVVAEIKSIVADTKSLLNEWKPAVVEAKPNTSRGLLLSDGEDTLDDETDWTESKVFKREIKYIFDKVRNILLLDPLRELRLPTSEDGEKVTSFFRAWTGEQYFREHSLMRSTIPQTLRGDILNSAGLKPGELDPKETPKANLADFRVKFITDGAFKIKTTTDPSLHLRFDESDFRRPTLCILDSRTITMLALLDLTGLMKELKLPSYLNELFLSHSLFFGRPTPFLKSIAEKYPDVDAALIQDYQQYWSESIAAVHISDFPIYGTRLATIHTRMTDWRALRFDHAVRFRPYRDTLPYYVFWFGILIGLMGLTGLGINITSYLQKKNPPTHVQ